MMDARRAGWVAGFGEKLGGGPLGGELIGTSKR